MGELASFARALVPAFTHPTYAPADDACSRVNHEVVKQLWIGGKSLHGVAQIMIHLGTVLLRAFQSRAFISLSGRLCALAQQ